MPHTSIENDLKQALIRISELESVVLRLNMEIAEHHSTQLSHVQKFEDVWATIHSLANRVDKMNSK